MAAYDPNSFIIRIAGGATWVQTYIHSSIPTVTTRPRSAGLSASGPLSDATERRSQADKKAGSRASPAQKQMVPFMRCQTSHQIHLAVEAAQLALRWPWRWDVTHLHLPLGQPLLPGPLANVIRVTSLEGYSGHGPLTKAALPTTSPSQPASTSLFKVFKGGRKGG